MASIASLRAKAKALRSRIIFHARRGRRAKTLRRAYQRTKRDLARATRAAKRAVAGDNQWGGSRQVTNEIVRIVNGRARITSRKRTQTYGNPGSDHHVSQKQADAVDFGIANAHWLKNEISRKLGGPSTLPDYGTFHIWRNGKRFRVQGIAGTHGTGPHLHYGVERVG